MIVRTNLGGLMRNSKNINMFRDLKTTSLVYVNLTACDLKNPLVEKIVLALRPLKTIQKLVVAENFELELMALDLMFKTKKIKVTVDEDN
jgi:hypothetical protein